MEVLNTPPKRNTIEKEVQQAEQRSYERSYKQTRVEAAKVKGAADGASAALEGARQRVVNGESPFPEVKPRIAPLAKKEVDLERIKLPDGTEVPKSYYDLDSNDQKRLVELIKQQEKKKADDSVAIEAVNKLLDLREADSKKIRRLESMVGSFLPILESMQRQIDGINTSIEIKKSEELVDQQVEISQQTTNLQAIGAKEQIDHDRRVSEAQAQAVDHQQRITAAEEPVARLEGRVKATMELAQERGNAVVDQVAGVESRVSKVDVRLQEVEGRVDVLGNPITRPEVVGVVTEVVSKEMTDQLEPALEALIERRYVLLSPTTGSDGYRQESNANTAPIPFLAKQPEGGGMEREVKRALKSQKRS